MHCVWLWPWSIKDIALGSHSYSAPILHQYYAILVHQYIHFTQHQDSCSGSLAMLLPRFVMLCLLWIQTISISNLHCTSSTLVPRHKCTSSALTPVHKRTSCAPTPVHNCVSSAPTLVHKCTSSALTPVHKCTSCAPTPVHKCTICALTLVHKCTSCALTLVHKCTSCAQVCSSTEVSAPPAQLTVLVCKVGRVQWWCVCVGCVVNTTQNI